MTRGLTWSYQTQLGRTPEMLALALILLVWTQPAHAQAKKPLEEKTIDLRSAILNETLPFDVPFIVTGAIDKSVTEVYARIAEVRPGEQGRADLRCPAPESPAWRELQPWRAVVDLPVPTTTPEGNPNFRILFPRLRANGFYCVTFELGPETELTEAQLDAFRTRSRPLIDLAIREYAEADEIPVTATDALRQRLLEIVRTLSGVKTPKPEVGSIFDPRQTAAQVHDRFADLLQPILIEQAGRRDMRRGLEARKQPLADGARGLRGQVAAIAKLRASRGLAPSDLEAWGQRAAAALDAAVQSLQQLNEPWEIGPVDVVANNFRLAQSELDRGVDIVAATRKEIVTPTATASDVSLMDALQTALTTNRSTLVPEVLLFLGGPPPADPDTGLRNRLRLRGAALDDVMGEFSNLARTQIDLMTTTVGSFDTRHGWYVSGDFGMAYGWDIDQVFAYIGTNIYFRPVNKDAPLQSFGNFAQSFTRRFSAMVGVTVAGDAEEEGRREAIIGDRLLVIGAGVRLTDSIRVAGGGLLFKAVDPSPLATQKDVKISPFISLSFDVDVVGTLGELGSAFGAGQPQPQN